MLIDLFLAGVYLLGGDDPEATRIISEREIQRLRKLKLTLNKPQDLDHIPKLLTRQLLKVTLFRKGNNVKYVKNSYHCRSL